MNGETKVRVFVTLPVSLVKDIETHVKAKPNDLNGKLNKYVQIGYREITKIQPPMSEGQTGQGHPV